ncbi:hypothetical protein MMC07_007018 [Pseudocyphellaria aurata]|nr:hypothetical protein [Pseudocyphellaria aurata]
MWPIDPHIATAISRASNSSSAKIGPTAKLNTPEFREVGRLLSMDRYCPSSRGMYPVLNLHSRSSQRAKMCRWIGGNGPFTLKHQHSNALGSEPIAEAHHDGIHANLVEGVISTQHHWPIPIYIHCFDIKNVAAHVLLLQPGDRPATSIFDERYGSIRESKPHTTVTSTAVEEVSAILLSETPPLVTIAVDNGIAAPILRGFHTQLKTATIEAFLESLDAIPGSSRVCPKIITFSNRVHKRNWEEFTWAQTHATYSFTANLGLQGARNRLFYFCHPPGTWVGSDKDWRTEPWHTWAVALIAIDNEVGLTMVIYDTDCKTPAQLSAKGLPWKMKSLGLHLPFYEYWRRTKLGRNIQRVYYNQDVEQHKKKEKCPYYSLKWMGERVNWMSFDLGARAPCLLFLQGATNRLFYFCHPPGTWVGSDRDWRTEPWHSWAVALIATDNEVGLTMVIYDTDCKTPAQLSANGLLWQMKSLGLHLPFCEYWRRTKLGRNIQRIFYNQDVRYKKKEKCLYFSLK